MMYFANIYGWKALLKFYAAWVRRIEIGYKSGGAPIVTSKGYLHQKVIKGQSKALL